MSDTRARKAMSDKFKIDRPKNKLSITPNLTGTEAWVKLVNDHNLNFPILDKAFTNEEHRLKVQKDIYSPEWQINE